MKNNLFSLNSFLSSAEGQSAIDRITLGLDRIKQQIHDKHITHHNNILKEMKLVLGDEQPLIPKGSTAPAPGAITPPIVQQAEIDPTDPTKQV